MADKKPSIYEQGMSGLNYTLAGTVEEEYLPQLRGREATRIYKEMSDNDPVVASIIFAIIMLLRQVEWYPENHPDAKDDEGKEFLQECMDDMSHSWPDFISEVVSMIIYGWSIFEIVYKVRNGPADGIVSGKGSKYKDGKIGWRKFAGRSQDSLDRWIFDESGGIAGFCQKPPPRYQDIIIPIEKCLLFRTSTYKASPEGRALTLDTPIPTPNGWRTMGDLGVGDQIFDEKGMIRYVTATQQWDDRPTYEITFQDGSTITADANHEWMVGRVTDRNTLVKRTTAEMAARVQNTNGVTEWTTPWAGAVQYPRQDHLLDPWYLGLWLGDGTSLSGDISCHADDADETAALIEQAGYSTKISQNGIEGCLGRHISVYGTRLPLRALGLKGNKHIPESYLRGSIPQRLALLQGLMDSDGCVDKDGRCEFVNTNRDLVDGVAELVRSLGVSAYVSLRKAATDERSEAWCVKFTPHTFAPFRLARKAERCGQTRARTNHYFRSIVPAATQTTKCIEVDSPSHMYLAGTAFVPTHNSVLRAAYRPWYYKKRFEEIQGVGIERDLAGLPFAEVDPAILASDANPQQKAMLAAIENIVKNARQGTQAGIIWPAVYSEGGQKLFDFKLLTSGGSRSFDINAVIQNCDQRIAMTVLADFILLGHENVGSFALSSDKTNLFTVALGAWLTSIEDVLNRYAVPRLFAMNNMDLTTLPRIKHGDIEKPDMVQLASFLATITSIGMPTFPDPNLEQFVRKAAGLPEPTEQATNAFKQKEEQELQAIIQQLAEQGDFPPQMQSVLMASGLVEPGTFDQEGEGGDGTEPPPEGEEPMPFEEG